MSKTKAVTQKVRFSYVRVFKAEAMKEGDTPKYSVCVMIDKEDKKTIKAIEDALEAAKDLGKDSKWGGKIPKNLKTPLRDGDEDREDQEEFEGRMFLNASTLNKPALIDADGDEIIDPDEFYSGCYGRISINLYPYEFSGSKGVACGINMIKKLEDGERLGGGGSSSASDFDDDDDLI